MPFDIQKFGQANFKARTKKIEVPKLKEFFTDGEEPVWTIRALTAEDLAIASSAVERNRSMNTLLTAMVSASNKEKSSAIQEIMGIQSEKMPDEVLRRIDVILLGSPDLDSSNQDHRQLVLKLSQFYPGTFMNLSNEIYALSGEGPEIEGKP